MLYKPKLSRKEIEENHRIFEERVNIYKKRGMDFLKIRNFIIEKSMPLEGNILEIGTGTGHTALTLAKAGYKLTSIDRDKEVLKKAALNLAYEDLLPKVTLHVMDAKSLEFKNGSFNNVIAVNMFHHVNDIGDILDEMDRVAAPNGKIIVSDFTEKGMRVVDQVHNHEGNSHDYSRVAEEEVSKRLKELNYDTIQYEGDAQWLITAKKAVK
ncbi:MAG: class I SAM-dependent methyltransferase [Candidatus Omnitrophica bacterium]|nr:class I SAM-dependent methyltransferase [Candidatus Omnitrophota bacterium]